MIDDLKDIAIFTHHPDFRMTAFDRFKAVIWKYGLAFIIPLVRDILLFFHLIRHKSRQPFLIGHLRPDRTPEDLRRHLVKHHFEEHFPCWRDDGEVVDVRLRKNFEYQYHLRVFKDGEVRGHYEFTPEYKPFKHIFDIGMTDRMEDFMELVGHIITPYPHPEDMQARGYRYGKE
jgi:hypothetical protein